MKDEITIFWFRRDLRLADNAALYHALKNHQNVLPVFIFDTEILSQLEDKFDRRVDFIHQALEQIKSRLKKLGSDLLIIHSNPKDAFKSITKNYNVKNVYTNHDYEPYAISRDEEIKSFLTEKKIKFHTYKDQCIFEKNEVVKEDGKPYTVFTPYSKKWKSKLTPFFYKKYPTETYQKNFLRHTLNGTITLKQLGFIKTEISFNGMVDVDEEIIRKYEEQRDYPGLAGTSRLSMHLRFGTISIRALVKKAMALNETFLNELIWRDFYMMILFQFPHVAENSFRREYDHIPWRNNEQEFGKWCKGETGFPIVDAGMRELNETGFMHNRVRMIVSSFLVKDLLIDWRWGEAYFAKKLNDFDLSANNGGWQWAAGSGCDAAPYFRIFNPDSQQKKFDPDFKYIKKWLPEFGTEKYPAPIVDHALARVRALSVYKTALAEQKQMKLF
ncbi:MAG: deoxyribodipyrimidine photo-lyase [Bacteroidetes bacterium]|nr:deoxyribodipyrimidine photo-lyase [Bacteroidota bacterium]